MCDAVDDVLGTLRGAAFARRDLLALAFTPGTGAGIAAAPPGPAIAIVAEDAVRVISAVEDELAPRWVLWSAATATTCLAVGLRMARSWDIAAAHRVLFGGRAADAPRVWALLHGLSLDEIPTTAPATLFGGGDRADGGDPEDPVRDDGYLDATWAGGAWATTADRLRRWAEIGAMVAGLQAARLDHIGRDGRGRATVRAESAAELLCAEMSVDGLPLRRDIAEQIVADIVGPRPRSATEAAEQRASRDAEVLRHARGGAAVDLRSPVQVRELLRRSGLDLADPRAWRLQDLEGDHPLAAALLRWRKAERVDTTYGYGWLEEHLGDDGRLRGTWAASDGAAGRMTASSGLHNMPTEMRAAVVAEPGYVFVRADLAQIEPRVLAAISGDAALARATSGDDLYHAVAAELGVDRPTAKVAVLGAMYGQTTGHGAQALRGLLAAYPVAMAYLEQAARSGAAGRDLRTFGGRLAVTGSVRSASDPAENRRLAARRGRYARNAVVQGAAAELFKVWAAIVRARGAPVGARIVLCLHDELLVHVPETAGPVAVDLVERALEEAVRRWAPVTEVRFLADVAMIDRWADAKA